MWRGNKDKRRSWELETLTELLLHSGESQAGVKNLAHPSVSSAHHSQYLVSALVVISLNEIECVFVILPLKMITNYEFLKKDFVFFFLKYYINYILFLF